MPLWGGGFGRQRAGRNPGRFNRLIEIQASTEAAGDGGDAQQSWASASPPLMVHARWRQLSQRESTIEDARFSTAAGVWEIPWLPSLTTRHRVVYGERYYNIIGIENLEERNRELHLYCREDEGAKGA